MKAARILKQLPRIARSFLGIKRKRRDLGHELLVAYGPARAAHRGDFLLESPSDTREHPHPQFMRRGFWLLDGQWEFALERHRSIEAALGSLGAGTAPANFEGRIVVPYPPESALSGTGGLTVGPNDVTWYRCRFSTPSLADGWRLLLHFEAVDWSCAVQVNGKRAGNHEGCYLPFSFDITDLVGEEGFLNELTVSVYDPSEFGTQLRGKQRIERCGIWYTAQSGIWQSVWLEAVPREHISRLDIDSANLEGTVKLEIDCIPPRQAPVNLTATIPEGRSEITAETVSVPSTNAGEGNVRPTAASMELRIAIDDPKAWAPDNPTLYRLRIEYGEDCVESYFAFRTAEVRRGADGLPRFHLNGRPFFLRGALDQGYWPESLMTPPCAEALALDVRGARELGFNMVRKHVKIEADRWYFECDRQGLLVWQDVPTGGVGWNEWHTTTKPSTFRSHVTDRDDTPRAWKRHSAGDPRYREEWKGTCRGMVRYLHNHPSIVTWSLFNEGWGQFNSKEAVELVRKLDPTRPVDAASGWFDQGAGDYVSIHDYDREPALPLGQLATGRRALVLSEFGGLSLRVPGHTFSAYNFGYAQFRSSDTWSACLQDTFSRAEALRAAGLSGYVYTQLYDVEEETNGLLTYDRIRKTAI